MSSSPNRFQLPLSFVKGDSFALSLQLTDMTVMPNVPKNIGGWGVAFNVFNANGHQIISVTTNSGSGTAGQIIFTGLPSVGKQFVNNSNYTIFITSPDGTQKITLLSGPITLEPTGSSTDTQATFDVQSGTLQVDFQQLQLVFNLDTLSGAAGFVGKFSTSSALPSITTVQTNAYAFVGSNLELWIAGSSSWTDTGIPIKGTDGAPGPPGLGAVQITRWITFGDSYGAVSLTGFGDLANSNGAPYTALMSYVLGLPMLGRWRGGTYSNTLGWDNYAVAGSNLFGTLAGTIGGQVAQFETDFANAVPSGTVLFFQLTGINDTSEIVAGYGGGMVTTADPLGTAWPSFTEPAVGSPVTVTAPSIPTGLASGTTPIQWVWIGGSLFSVTGISGTSVTLTKQAAVWNTTILAAGATNPGGNLRWACAQIIDDLMTYWVNIIDTLIADGAAAIIVSTCPPWNNNLNFVSTITGASQAQIKNTISRWNTKLNAAVASISQVHVFDLFGAMTNIWANPPAYGLYNMDGQAESNANISTANDFGFADQVHASATTHSAIALQLFQFLLTWVPVTLQTAPQLSLAKQLLNSAGFAASPSHFILGTGSTAVAWNPLLGNVIPVPIQSTDNRLALARSVERPHTVVRSLDDWLTISQAFQDLATTPPDPTWTTVMAGSGQAVTGPGSSYYTKGTTGLVILQTNAANDSAGLIKSGLPLIVGGSLNGLGYVHIIFNSSISWIAGDTSVIRFGLVDGISATVRPNNGIFIEIAITSGVLTGQVVYATSASGSAIYTTYGFTMPTLANGAPAGAFELASDYEQRRWFLYYKGVLIPFNNTPWPTYALFPTLPAGILLCKAMQITTTVSVGGSDGIFNTNLDVVIRNARL
jgi:hypothetical protein